MEYRLNIRILELTFLYSLSFYLYLISLIILYIQSVPRNIPVGANSWIVFFHTLYKILKTFCSLFSLKNFYYNMDAIKYLLSFSLATNNLTYYGRRHFKLFTNCHAFVNTPIKINVKFLQGLCNLVSSMF